MTPAQKELMRKVASATVSHSGPPSLRAPKVSTNRLGHFGTIRACIRRRWLEWVSKDDYVRITDKGREELKRATFRIVSIHGLAREHDNPPPGFLPCTRPVPHDGPCAHPPERRFDMRCHVPTPTDADLMTYTRAVVGNVAREELAAKVRAFFESYDGHNPRYRERENALRVAVGLEPRP